MKKYRVSLLLKSLGGGLPHVANQFDCDTKAEAAKHGEDWVAGDRPNRSYSIDDVDDTEEADKPFPAR
jgi:hypothetical protein